MMPATIKALDEAFQAEIWLLDCAICYLEEQSKFNKEQLLMAAEDYAIAWKKSPLHQHLEEPVPGDKSRKGA